MKKVYFIVDSSNRYIVEKHQVGRRGQIHFDEQPGKRIRIVAGYTGLACTAVGMILGSYECFCTSTRQISLLTIVLSCMLFPCTYIALLIEKLASKGGNSVQSNKHFGSWKDPYGLAQGDTDDIPGKKTYYIVDSETNAIVDVKRLGKWGQAYIEWRSRRQKEKA